MAKNYQYYWVPIFGMSLISAVAGEVSKPITAIAPGSTLTCLKKIKIDDCKFMDSQTLYVSATSYTCHAIKALFSGSACSIIFIANTKNWVSGNLTIEPSSCEVKSPPKVTSGTSGVLIEFKPSKKCLIGGVFCKRTPFDWQKEPIDIESLKTNFGKSFGWYITTVDANRISAAVNNEFNAKESSGLTGKSIPNSESKIKSSGNAK